MKKWILAISSTLLLSAGAAADPISVGEIVDGTTYELGNHPNGGIRPPLYGLRLDGLLGDRSEEFTFNFEMMGASMTMVKNGSNLTISGTAWGGEDVGGAYGPDAELWTITFTYTDLGTAGCGAWCANTGSGTITGSPGTYELTSQRNDNGDGFAFRLGDGHRGVPTASGWGWLNHCITEDGQDGISECNRHVYASDWLFTVHKVSEPETLALLGMGLLVLGLSRRRRQMD